MDHTSQTETIGHAGGAIFNKYGASFANFANYNNSLLTNKSYFVLDDEILILGHNNIVGDNIKTTIDNRLGGEFSENASNGL
jgi:hypothetical protein